MTLRRRVPVQAPTLASLLAYTNASAASNPDPSVRASLAPGLDGAYLGAVASAAAALNAQTDAAATPADIEKSAFYAQSVVRCLSQLPPS